MRCCWCGGEVLPEMIYIYKTMQKPLRPDLAEYLAEALAGKEFCSGRCMQNYIRAALPEEKEEYKAS